MTFSPSVFGRTILFQAGSSLPCFVSCFVIAASGYFSSRAGRVPTHILSGNPTLPVTKKYAHFEIVGFVSSVYRSRYLKEKSYEKQKINRQRLLLNSFTIFTSVSGFVCVLIFMFFLNILSSRKHGFKTKHVLFR